MKPCLPYWRYFLSACYQVCVLMSPVIKLFMRPLHGISIRGNIHCLFIMHAQLLVCTCMVLMMIVDGHYIGMLVQCNPDLIPSVPSGSQVFINQPITIQCTTMGSQLLAWQSVEYIGPGQQLTFNLNSMPGDTRTSSVGAVVTFIRVANSNNGVMLQSVLRISVISTFTNFTVTCRNVDTGSEESVTYQTMSKYCSSSKLFSINIITVIYMPQL